MRRCQNSGGFACLIRRGADQAGAIFVTLRGREGRCDLFAPAPQILLSDHSGDERIFEHVLQGVDMAAVEKRLESEMRFDPDIWIIEVEGIAEDPMLTLVNAS